MERYSFRGRAEEGRILCVDKMGQDRLEGEFREILVGRKALEDGRFS